jgi:hypothetical protein
MQIETAFSGNRAARVTRFSAKATRFYSVAPPLRVGLGLPSAMGALSCRSSGIKVGFSNNAEALRLL